MRAVVLHHLAVGIVVVIRAVVPAAALQLRLRRVEGEGNRGERFGAGRRRRGDGGGKRGGGGGVYDGP